MKPLSECRLLLVDDTKANLDILVDGLKRDYKLSLARSGEEALRLATHAVPDLVLLDIMMPGLDGYEVCRRLRAQPETAETPIIFLSSLDEVQNKARGFEAGANDYVTKPFELLEVKARVHSLLKVKAYNEAVKEQIESELRVARDIQMGMVPHDFAPLEQRYGIELAGSIEPARQVGGDLYLTFAAHQERLVLAMGDVSGKGIPAALFMVRATSFLQLLARDVAEPNRILARLNDELAADNPSEMFVTLSCAIYEPATRRLKLSNGGQTRPLLLRSGEPPRWLVDRLGTALGLEPDLEYDQIECQLQPGDSVLLYTDGVTEAFNPKSECYGDGRLLAATAAASPLTATGLLEALLTDVSHFAKGAPQSDDISLLALHLPRSAASSTTPLAASEESEFSATAAEVMRAVDVLRTFCQARHLSEKTTFGLALALEESASNVLHHAYHDNPEKRFQVKLTLAARRFTIELRDQGPPFDPTRPRGSSTDTPVALEDREPGGWGLDLVRHYMDETEYQREGDANVLRLRKQV